MARKTTGRGDTRTRRALVRSCRAADDFGNREAPGRAGRRRAHPRASSLSPTRRYLRDGHGLVLMADLPGVSPDGLDITLEKRVLTIHGRADDDTPEGYSPVYREYEVGDFERSFTLAGDFDEDKIEADLRDGVLRLSIPRAPEPEARRIEVRTS